MRNDLTEIFRRLDFFYRKKWEKEKGRPLHDWWPVSGRFTPKELEIVAGTILTQNTNWRNVEKAVRNMIDAGLTDAEALANCSRRKLQKIIKPAGFFTQKSERLKTLAKFVLEFEGDFYKAVTREQLLGVKGIGKETADSILLYACGRPEFVVDAYTRRILARYGLVDKNAKCDEIKELFEKNIKKDAKLYKEFHAMLVEHAKETCRKKPLCGQCPLADGCEKREVALK